MNPLNIIVACIQKKQCISFSYDGHMRHAAPHVVGNKNGDLQMLVWQYGGSGKSGPVLGDWKCMKLDKVSGLAPNSDAWATGGSHTQPQTCVDDKLEEVNY